MAKGGGSQVGHGNRRRHAERGAGMRVRGWREGRVQMTSRWTALRSGRGGGERVHERGYTTENTTDGGAVGQG